MNDAAQAALRSILATHGPGIIEDQRRMRAELLDKCGSYRKEMNTLLAALQEGIPQQLQRGAPTSNADVLIAGLVHELQAARALDPDSARWAVESWAMALGLPGHTSPGGTGGTSGTGTGAGTGTSGTGTGGTGTGTEGPEGTEGTQTDTDTWVPPSPLPPPPPFPPPPPPRPRSTPAWLLPALGSAVTIAVVIGLIIALSGGDDTPTAGPSTTGSTAATTAPSTSGPTTVSTTTTSTTIGSAADLLLSDDFASGSRWSKGEDTDSIWGPGSGQYRIMIKTSDSVRIRAPFTGEIPARLRLEVSATRPVRADFGFFGLYCRGQGDSGNPYYEGHINSNGYWRIRRVEPGSTPNRTLAEPSTSTEYSSAIRATGSNRVVFDCLGGTGGSVRLTLWANGQKIADVVDNQGLPGGSAGILANADQPLEILFDDFAARRI